MSLPRVMTIDDEARLVSIPAPELESLRDMHHHIEQITVEPEKSGYISDISGDALEIAVQFTVGEAAAFGLSLRRSPDGQEETRVFYDTIAQRLVINRRRSSLSTTVRRDTIHAPLPIERGSTLNLRIFVDRSVIEVYADSGRTVMTARIYPTRADSTGIDLFSDGDVTVIDTLDVWTMKAIWPIR